MVTLDPPSAAAADQESGPSTDDLILHIVEALQAARTSVSQAPGAAVSGIGVLLTAFATTRELAENNPIGTVEYVTTLLAGVALIIVGLVMISVDRNGLTKSVTTVLKQERSVPLGWVSPSRNIGDTDVGKATKPM
jgi:hypothetical protein